MSRQSKRQLREQLRRQTESYLSAGGEIKSVSPGATGLAKFSAGRSQSELFIGAPRQSRTYLNEAVAALDKRKQSAKTGYKASKPATRRRKKMIYDDFGEPLREIWVEE